MNFIVSYCIVLYCLSLCKALLADGLKGMESLRDLNESARGFIRGG